MMRDKQMNDDELDRLLAAASRPALPVGALARLNARLAQESGAGNVIALQRKAPAQRRRLGWLAGLPLAASLALGLYLGSAGGGSSLLPAAFTETLVGVSSAGPETGIEEAESWAEEDLT